MDLQKWCLCGQKVLLYIIETADIVCGGGGGTTFKVPSKHLLYSSPSLSFNPTGELCATVGARGGGCVSTVRRDSGPQSHQVDPPQLGRRRPPQNLPEDVPTSAAWRETAPGATAFLLLHQEEETDCELLALLPAHSLPVFFS